MRTITVTPILLIFAMLVISPVRLSAQDDASEPLKAVLAHIVENRLGHDSRTLVIAANKVLRRVHELRFVAQDGAWSEVERDAMLDAATSVGSSTRLCEMNCHDIDKTEMLLTFGRPEKADDGSVTLLVEDFGVSDGSSGRRIVSYRLEEVEGRWSVTERKFVMASDAVRCRHPAKC